MSFLSVLRNDFKVFLKCSNYLRLTGTKPKHSNYRAAVFCRTYCEVRSTPAVEKPIGNKTVARLKKYDEIPSDFNLIYRAPRSFWFSFAQGVLLLSSISIPGMIFIVAEKNDFKLPIKIAEDIIISNAYQIICILATISVLLGMVFILVSRFPLRLYHNKGSNDYIATYSNLVLPWKMTKVYFKKGEVSRISDKESLPFQLSNYKIKGIKNIFLEDFFIRPLDLELMMKSE